MSFDDLLESLTKPQREAVIHTQGPLLVLAGAGSGKTRVITRRAAYIARTIHRPDQVLAITFTNKAAGEMRDRLAALGIGRRMWICTFHSLCARLLREYGERIGLSRNFSIFDQADSRSLVRKAIEACDLNTTNWRPPVILNSISQAKTRLQTPEEFQADAWDFRSKTIARIYAEYQRLLNAQSACDFDDLLMRVAKMLGENDAIRCELSDRFRYLLIDEYQDTNHAQYLIAARLAEAHHNICATGDPDQSIYAWRGADIQNILDFETDYPDAAVVRLEQNFRSTGGILSAASSLIAQNQRRREKRLWTQGEWGHRVQVWHCDDERHEADVILQDIRRYCDGDGKPGDVAIFYRVNALTRILEDALRRANVPYQIARGVEFYARKEIKDVLAYLRIVCNPADETALLRAINTPARGIGKVTIGRLKRFALDQGITLDQAVAQARQIETLKSAWKKVQPLADLLKGLRALPARPVLGIVDAVVKRSGIEAALAATGDEENEPLDNVRELITAARQYDEDNPDGNLSGWLQEISLLSDVDQIELGGGAVTLMTLHSAKGLEFPVVYIVGMEDGLLPHSRSLHDQENTTAIEEERRLCFVGMTRAMRRLTLTCARYRMVRGETLRASASRFLRELPCDEIDEETIDKDEDRSLSHLGRFNEGEFSQDDAVYFPGRRVRHEMYGEGQVVRLEPRGRSLYICIQFKDEGERSFALEHVPLYIIEE